MKNGLLIALAVFVALAVASSAPPAMARQAQAVEKPKAKTVELSIRFADGKTRRFEQAAWREGMTVLDLMESCKTKDSRGLRFEHRGSGATAFLTSIDGVANEKGRAGNAWIFRVNGKLGSRSFGTTTLKPGDSVLWHFGKYDPNEP